VIGISPISRLDQVFVKFLLVYTSLVTGNQHNANPAWIKCKGDPPDATLMVVLKLYRPIHRKYYALDGICHTSDKLCETYQLSEYSVGLALKTARKLVPII